MIDTAVIIAGGKGLRLGPETLEKPKAMAKVHKRPIIEWIILWLKKNDIYKVIISVDHKKEVLMDYVGDGSGLGVNITYNDHSGCNETGDVFRHVLENQDLPEVFLAMNGDQITDLSIKDVFSQHKRHNPIATIVACPVRIPYGILNITEENTINAFSEKPVLPDIFMNTGIYIFNKSILQHLPQRGPIEKTTFTKLVEIGELKAYTHKGLFTTINDQKDLAEAQKILQDTEVELL